VIQPISKPEELPTIPNIQKKPLISIQDRPSLTNSTSSVFSYYNKKKKRPCPSNLLSPPKKGPGAVVENAEPPNTAPSNFLLFSPDTIETKPTRALFKAVRKGKSKIGSAVHEPEVTYKENGGYVKPPQQQ
jgi:hypothetical protein